MTLAIVLLTYPLEVAKSVPPASPVDEAARYQAEPLRVVLAIVMRPTAGVVDEKDNMVLVAGMTLAPLSLNIEVTLRV
jgi:hypothetical protein